ncbi:MAG: hypothetical protein ABW215_14190 [Kibdelosporangium sp.]
MRTAMLTVVLLVLAGCAANEPETATMAKSDEIGRTAIGFSQCMRDRGHQVPDPAFNDDGLPVFQETGRDGPAYEADRRECLAPLGDAMRAAGVANPKGSPEQWLAFARCMRENGVEVPDPTAENRMSIDKNAYDSPAWQPAAQACGSLLPPGMRDLLQPLGPKGGNGK